MAKRPPVRVGFRPVPQRVTPGGRHMMDVGDGVPQRMFDPVPLTIGGAVPPIGGQHLMDVGDYNDGMIRPQEPARYFPESAPGREPMLPRPIDPSAMPGPGHPIDHANELLRAIMEQGAPAHAGVADQFGRLAGNRPGLPGPGMLDELLGQIPARTRSRRSSNLNDLRSRFIQMHLAGRG